MGFASDREASAPIEHATSAQSPEGAAEAWKPVTGDGRPAAGIPRTIFLLGTAGFLVAISWQVVLPFLPLHLSNIGYSAAQIGALVSLLSLAMGAVELEIGRIAGWVGRPWTLLGGVLGNAAAIALVFYAASFPVVFNTWTGVKTVNRLWIRAAEAMGADEGTLFSKVVLPGALPFVITGLRQAFARAWIAVVGGEMIAATSWGLGWVIFDAKEFLNTDVMLASLVVIGILGVVFERLIFQIVERRTVGRWGMVKAGKG